MNHPRYCPKCGTLVVKYSNPLPTADVIVYDPQRGVILIKRKNPPYGFAIPGGFVEEGETVEHAAVREIREETSLDVELKGILGVYSHPMRDMRCHVMTTVFVARAKDLRKLCAGDDAQDAQFYALDGIPGELCFDHAKVMDHFRQWLLGTRPLLPCCEDPSLEYGEIPYIRPF